MRQYKPRRMRQATDRGMPLGGMCGELRPGGATAVLLFALAAWVIVAQGVMDGR